jgi:hypothetical protein
MTCMSRMRSNGLLGAMTCMLLATLACELALPIREVANTPDAAHDAPSASCDGRGADAAEFAGSCATCPVFADNFSAAHAPGGYTTINGTWVRSSGTYTVTWPDESDPELIRAYALIDGDYGDFDVTIEGHSISGDGFGLIYAATSVGDGYAVIIHPEEYDGLYFKQLHPVCGTLLEGDNNIGSVTFPALSDPAAPFTLHVVRMVGDAGMGNVTASLSSPALSQTYTLNAAEQGPPHTGPLGLVWSPTSSLEGAVFTGFTVTTASCVLTTPRDASCVGSDSGAD